MKKQETNLFCNYLLNSATCMDVKVHILFFKNCSVYIGDDKPDMMMSKQIDVKVTKPQNKSGHEKNRKCPFVAVQSVGFFYRIVQ